MQLDAQKGKTGRSDLSCNLDPKLCKLSYLPAYLLPVAMPFASLTLGDFSRSRWSQLDNLPNTQKNVVPVNISTHSYKSLLFCVLCCGLRIFFYVLEMTVSYVLMKHSQFASVISSTDYMHFCFQFQKQGKDLEKVKQRLVEIANYVDKVKHPPPLCTGGINHLFKIEIFLAAEINGTSAWYINFLLKQLTLVCLTPLPELCLYSLHAA